MESGEPTHRSTQSTIDFQDSKSVQVFGIFRFRELGIRNNLILSRGFDTIPVTFGNIRFRGYFLGHDDLQILTLGAFGEVTREKVEKGLHFCIECLYRSVVSMQTTMTTNSAYLFRLGIADGPYEMTDLISHGLCSNTCGGGLEIDVAGSPNPGIERVASRHQ